jgi:Caspase domain
MATTDRRVTRHALVVAAGSYRDPALSDLRAAAQDAFDLGAVLGEPRIGGFSVTWLLDGTERDVRVGVTDLLAARGVDDLVLLYVSCHGLLDARRQLYFATTDTQASRPAATAVDAQWLSARLDECRAQQIVILDCCYSGAFARGAKAGDLDLEQLVTGPARGRVVLTASRSTESSFEGDPRFHGGSVGSVFTSALVEGIRSGGADRDDDGVITIDEAFDYAYRRVRELGSPQTPQLSLLGGEGRLMLAQRPGRPPSTVSGPQPSGSGARTAPGPPGTAPPSRAAAPEPDHSRSTAPAPVRSDPTAPPIRPGRAWIVLALVAALVVIVVVVNAAVAATRLR